MRAALVLLVPGLAAADSRLDLSPLPELSLLEPAHHFVRGSRGIAANVGVGFGRHRGEAGVVGEGALRLGLQMRRFAAAAGSELVAGAGELVRGRHTGFLELRTDDTGADEDLTGRVLVRAALEHGEARALAPVYLGPGRRDHAAASADLLVGLARDRKDLFAGLVQADGSVTRWLDAPLLDRAHRGAIGLGVALAPGDDELPRGRFDIVRARVEHATIERGPVRAAGAPIADARVRTIEVMTGMHELAGHIDHDLLLAVTAQLGAVWLESDTAAGRIEDTFFKVELGGHFKWRARAAGRREIGVALARQPGPTPDGQHHASDWRLELVTGVEDRRFVFAARGGISWVTHVSGGVSDPAPLKRYGSHLEGFAKLGLGLEVGGYHAISYEPRVAGDPWSTPRTLATEVGVLARWRPSTY